MEESLSFETRVAVGVAVVVFVLFFTSLLMNNQGDENQGDARVDDEDVQQSTVPREERRCQCAVQLKATYANKYIIADTNSSVNLDWQYAPVSSKDPGEIMWSGVYFQLGTSIVPPDKNKPYSWAVGVVQSRASGEGNLAHLECVTPHPKEIGEFVVYVPKDDINEACHDDNKDEVCKRVCAEKSPRRIEEQNVKDEMLKACDAQWEHFAKPVYNLRQNIVSPSKLTAEYAVEWDCP